MAPRKLAFVLAALVALSSTLACYKGMPPGEAISAAEYALRKAEEDGARQHAPVVIRKAQDKLADAKVAQDEGANEHAVQLAQEVALEAQLADEMTRNARTKLLEQEAETGLAILREELTRAGR